MRQNTKKNACPWPGGGQKGGGAPSFLGETRCASEIGLYPRKFPGEPVFPGGRGRASSRCLSNASAKSLRSFLKSRFGKKGEAVNMASRTKDLQVEKIGSRRKKRTWTKDADIDKAREFRAKLAQGRAYLARGRVAEVFVAREGVQKRAQKSPGTSGEIS